MTEFKPTYARMRRIGKRVERKKFNLSMEKQGDEYIARLNWKNSYIVKNIIALGSIIYKQLGKEKTPFLQVSAMIRKPAEWPSTSPFNKEYLKRGKECFDKKIKPKFKDKFNRISADTRDNGVNFVGYFKFNGKSLSEDDLDIISDFMHNSFRCWVNQDIIP